MINPPRRQNSPATRSKVSAAVKSSPALAPGKPTDVKPSGFARFFSNVSLVAGCLWIVIGLSFLLTAGTNWHATILTEAVMLDVDVNNESVKKIFGMCTHIAFFVGELNFALGTTHLLNALGYAPAMAIAPAITFITIFVGLLKADIVFGWPAPYGGPTGLPIHGPPAPVPQIAIGVGSLLFFNMLYQLVAGGVLTDSSAPSFVQKRPKAVYFFMFLLIVGTPHTLSLMQRNVWLPDWRGFPVVRPE